MDSFQTLEGGSLGSQDVNIGNVPVFEESSQVSQDLSMSNLHILDEGTRICPLCSQEMRMYFINYSEKIEMCENLECDYPFGYEPLKIVREDNGVETVELKSIPTKGTRSVARSQTSSQGWSDVDKLCNVFDSEEAPTVDYNKLKTTPQLKKMESEKRKEELRENVEKIKQMTKSMNETKKESNRIIKNEKWIKNLQYLQGLSGVSLLKPEEMKQIKKKASGLGSGELKIDIDKNNLASITIEVNRAKVPNAKLV